MVNTAFQFVAAAFKYNFQHLPQDLVILTYWIGEKASSKSFASNPIQAKYRPKEDNDRYFKNFYLWGESNNRPLLKAAHSNNVDHHEIKNYAYLGKI